MLEPSLHSISSSIGQVLFKRGDIRDMFNQTDLADKAPEGKVAQQLTLWENFAGH